jgi:hypothetical protein
MIRTMTSTDLARRASACRHWRWLPGMACVNASMPDTWCARIGDERKPTYNHYLPDLTDPCTLGGLLSLVRAAWDDPHVYVLANGPDWFTVRSPNGMGGWLGPSPIDGSTEAAALVAALEAAP